MYYLDEENFSLKYARLTTLSILLLNTTTITTVLNCEVSLKNVLHFALINETKTVCFYQKKDTTNSSSFIDDCSFVRSAEIASCYLL